MTRFFWTLIALFPLPLVILLVAEPPELFERERVRAAQDIAALLSPSDIDWMTRFAVSKRLDLIDVLPQAATKYVDLGLVFERLSAGETVLITQAASKGSLRYDLAGACWMLPADQFSLLKRCPP